MFVFKSVIFYIVLHIFVYSFLLIYEYLFLFGGHSNLVTFPLDLTKTRLQIQGEYAPEKLSKSGTVHSAYRGMLSTAVGIAREEGLLKLWQGATPAIYRHIGNLHCIHR